MKRITALLLVFAVILSMTGCSGFPFNLFNNPDPGEASSNISSEPVSVDENAEKIKITLDLADDYIAQGDFEIAKKLLENALDKYGSQEIKDKLDEVQQKIDSLPPPPASSDAVSDPVSDVSSDVPESSPSSESPSSAAKNVDYAKKFVGTYYITNANEDNQGKITIKRKSNTKISFTIYRENALCSEEYTKSITVGQGNSFSFSHSNGAIDYKLTVKLVSKGKLKVTQKVTKVLIEGTDGVGMGGTYIAK